MLDKVLMDRCVLVCFLCMHISPQSPRIKMMIMITVIGKCTTFLLFLDLLPLKTTLFGSYTLKKIICYNGLSPHIFLLLPQTSDASSPPLLSLRSHLFSFPHFYVKLSLFLVPPHISSLSLMSHITSPFL